MDSHNVNFLRHGIYTFLFPCLLSPPEVFLWMKMHQWWPTDIFFVSANPAGVLSLWLYTGLPLWKTFLIFRGDNSVSRDQLEDHLIYVLLFFMPDDNSKITWREFRCCQFEVLYHYVLIKFCQKPKSNKLVLSSDSW